MRKGFTLLELIISVGIIGIVASVGLFALEGVRSRKTLGYETDKLIETLREAQQNSISELELAYWGIFADAVSGGSDTYKIFYASSVGAVASTTYRTVILPPQIEFSAPAQGSSSTVTFFKISGVPDASTTLTLQTIGGAETSSIDILENGNITR